LRRYSSDAWTYLSVPRIRLALSRPGGGAPSPRSPRQRRWEARARDSAHPVTMKIGSFIERWSNALFGSQLGRNLRQSDGPIMSPWQALLLLAMLAHLRARDLVNIVRRDDFGEGRNGAAERVARALPGTAADERWISVYGRARRMVETRYDRRIYLSGSSEISHQALSRAGGGE